MNTMSTIAGVTKIALDRYLEARKSGDPGACCQAASALFDRADELCRKTVSWGFDALLREQETNGYRPSFYERDQPDVAVLADVYDLAAELRGYPHTSYRPQKPQAPRPAEPVPEQWKRPIRMTDGSYCYAGFSIRRCFDSPTTHRKCKAQHGWIVSPSPYSRFVRDSEVRGESWAPTKQAAVREAARWITLAEAGTARGHVRAAVDAAMERLEEVAR